MNKFTIFPNKFLRKKTQAFFHTVYKGYQNPGNPDYINKLKNIFGNISTVSLKRAVQELEKVLLEDLPKILKILQYKTMTVCVVPRAKAECHYQKNQMMFKSTICTVANQLEGFVDGTAYISRHTDTKTTHLRKPIPNYVDKGPEPYPGITADTCTISSNVKGSDVLLIDDIYTRTVNIDEDAIQTLLDNGAHSVTFYAVGLTVSNQF